MRLSLFIEFALKIFFQVLQRKTEEAAVATKRLKELLEARKSVSRDNSGMYLHFNCTNASTSDLFGTPVLCSIKPLLKNK